MPRTEELSVKTDWRDRKTEYLQKLKDPRWQKKRLEILQRDGWKCTSCEAADRTLHVHHKVYRWGADPWEYETDQLVTLCVDCHELTTQLDNDLKQSERDFIENVFRRCGVLSRLLAAYIVTPERLDIFITLLEAEDREMRAKK